MSFACELSENVAKNRSHFDQAWTEQHQGNLKLYEQTHTHTLTHTGEMEMYVKLGEP